MDFTEDVKKAFQCLFDVFCYGGMLKNEPGKIIITVDDYGAYMRKLILHTSAEISVDNYDVFYFDEAQIIKDDRGYRLMCQAEDYESETIAPTNIFFDSATVDIKVYRADRRVFGYSPCETLSLIVSAISEKEDLGEAYINEKEREVILLLRDIDALSSWLPIMDEQFSDFACFKQFVHEHGLKHILPIIDKIKFLQGQAPCTKKCID